MLKEVAARQGAEVPRILIVSTVAVTLRAFLLPYADSLRSLNWRVEASASGVSQDPVLREHFDDVHEITWSRNPLDLRNVFKAVRHLRTVVGAREYDIVHVHTPVAAFVTRLALRRCAPKPVVIYTAHGFHFHPNGSWLRNRLFEALERIAGRWTDFLVTINRTDEAAAKRLSIVPPDRLLYMPGIGLDLSRYHPAAKNSSDKAPVFVVIAEFVANKRHADILRAFARMSIRNARLVLVGDGPLSGGMRALAKSLGVLARIDFVGRQQDVRPYIWDACATILASGREGLPRGVMESLACGVPVIGSDVRGTRDLLEHGGGMLFPVGDVNALAACMDKVAACPEQAREMGEIGRGTVEAFDLNSLVCLHQDLYSRALHSPKRSRTKVSLSLLNIVVSAFALVLLSPVLAALAISIRLRIGSPVLFRQQRPGLDGRLFTIYKFRTMREAYDTDGNPLPDSERLTRFGRFLRSTSLDELPELWNVLKGDMNLVGPRPLLPEYLSRYTEFQRRRHEVKPGITGWAQINGRNGLSWEEKFNLDVRYVDNRSLLLDFKILWLTFAAVFKREGIAENGHVTMSKFMGSLGS